MLFACSLAYVGCHPATTKVGAPARARHRCEVPIFEWVAAAGPGACLPRSGRAVRPGPLRVCRQARVSRRATARGAGGLPVQVELGVDVAQVPLDGADAQGQGLGDGVVVQPLGGEPQDLHLARRQLVEAPRCCRGVAPAPAPRLPGRSGREELAQLRAVDRPRRLVLEHDVVVALERDEPGSVDPRGEVAGLLEVVHPVAAGVEHQGGQVELAQQGAAVGREALAPRAAGGLGVGRDALQLVEPDVLLLGGVAGSSAT